MWLGRIACDEETEITVDEVKEAVLDEVDNDYILAVLIRAVVHGPEILAVKDFVKGVPMRQLGVEMAAHFLQSETGKEFVIRALGKEFYDSMDRHNDLGAFLSFYTVTVLALALQIMKDSQDD